MKQNFIHLHLHTQYSLLKGAIPIKTLAKALKELDYKTCAITDHGNMFGAVEFYQTLKKADLKPIIGMGGYVAKESRFKRDYEKRGPNAYQTILLCQDKEGYHNLTYLSSIAYTEGKHYGIPRIDHELLEKYNKGIIVLSAGLEGELAQHLLNGKMDEAISLASWYRDVFVGRYYIELQATGKDEQNDINSQLIDIATQLSIPLVGTNDCHYLKKDDNYAHYILELMGLQKRVSDHDIPVIKPNHLYLKSESEMLEAFENLPQSALENTIKIAEQCELSLDNQTYYLPNFEIPENFTLDSYFEHSAQEGLKKRLDLLYQMHTTEGDLPKSAPPQKSFVDFSKPYEERLQFELNVIINMKYSGYFLIVADFINWAKGQEIPVGPGRGSGAGSLVAYALRITDVDPLQYGLLFERFLNPDRISMPDFDIDFEVSGRDSVIEYVRKKYGENNVCQIATFQSLGAKAAIRGVARVLDFPYAEADKIAKLIPNKIGISLEESIQQEPQLLKMEQDGTENEQKLIPLARSLEGLTTHLGTHAAGVIIMDNDIREVMPVCTGKDGSLQSMYTMKYAEDQGAVKFDFLGLLTLSIIDAALKLINEPLEIENHLDIQMIPMNDALTFKLLCNGDTTGVFQLESSGMKKLVLDMQPDAFEDIVAIVALYRPGPLGSGMVDDFIECKHGRKQIVYPHPLMKSILEETYGVMVYQEQIMQAVQILAGFTLGQADLLRRAIGKKIAEILTEQRQNFVQGCLSNPEFVEGCGNIPPDEKANEIFDLIDYFSGYGFNKSHTVAYGLISYQTAYLKANYPVQFMAALLNCSMGNPDKVVNFISECKDMGIQVLPPDVNQSVKEFTVSFLGYQITPKVIEKLKLHKASNSILQALNKLEKGLYYQESELTEELKRHISHEELEPFYPIIMNAMHAEGVRFGLNAVKNIGGHTVDAILEARNKKEVNKFKDTMDFMKSVDLTKVNLRALEIFVKCGAFDSINPNRAQLFQALEEAVHIGIEYQKSVDPMQNSLFDLMSDEDAKNTETQLEFPEIRDWSTKQRLAFEKESLGFYVSGHPLDGYASEIKKLATNTYELSEKNLKEGDSVALAGIIIDKTIRLTKRSEKFAIIKIEDLRGTLEIPVYTKLYDEVKELLDLDDPILISGRVRYRDDEAGLIPEKVESLSKLREEKCRRITIEMKKDYINVDKLNNLKNIMLTSGRPSVVRPSGDCSVYFKVNTSEASETKIYIDNGIIPTPKLIDDLSEFLEGQKILFEY